MYNCLLPGNKCFISVNCKYSNRKCARQSVLLFFLRAAKYGEVTKYVVGTRKSVQTLLSETISEGRLSSPKWVDFRNSTPPASKVHCSINGLENSSSLEYSRQGPRLTLGSQTGEGTPKKVVF